LPKLVWFISRPALDIREAEELYQIGHVRRGMRQENLRSFRISRSLYPQPNGLTAITGDPMPAAFRFSEGYWDSFEDIEECYRSPNGLAALADGMLNASPRIPVTPLPVLLADEESLPCKHRLAFDIFNGMFSDAQPTKLFLFLGIGEAELAAFDADYHSIAEEVGEFEALGHHVLSTTRPYNLSLGKARTWPPEDAPYYQRILEYYFPNLDALNEFVAGSSFGRVMSLANRTADAVLPVAAEPQHVFFTTTGAQPLSEGWLSLYQ